MSTLRLRDLGTGGGKREVFFLEPNKIVIKPGHNPRRFDTPEMRLRLDSLKQSIKAQGILNAVAVNFTASTGTATLVDGETRTRACHELEAEGWGGRIPVYQDDSRTDEERLLRALIANDSKRLEAVEYGDAFRRFVRWGWSVERIAQEVAVEVRFVNECLTLDGAEAEVKELVETKQVTPALALSHIKQHGEGAVKTLLVAAARARSEGKLIATRTITKAPTALEKLVRALVEEAQESQDDSDGRYVRISISTIQKLAAAVGQPD